MNLRFVIISAACLSIAVPTTATSLLAAAAAVKGAILGAGLTALKTSGGSQTVIIQSQPGSVAEVVPANQVIVQQDTNKPVTVQTAQTITYTSSNPITRLWDAIAAKAKAIGNIFSPNRVVVIIPHTTTTTEKSTTSTTTTTTTTPKPTPTHKPLISIDFEHKPLPIIEVDTKSITLPGLGISASLGRDMYQVVPMAAVNYLKK